LAILLFFYMFISSRNSQDLLRQKKHYEDSIAAVTAKVNAEVAKAHATDNILDSAVVQPVRDTAGFNKALYGEPRLITLESDLLKVVFSTKGGQPEQVELKHYTSYDSTPV